MKTFPSAKIRNVALVGHGGAGKTTLAEALLHMAGVTQRMGRVEDGTTVSDFDPEEHKRGISVGLSVLPFEYEGHKINLLDCPGYADFVGDVSAALRVADMALFVISAVDGVEVQAEIAWKLAEQRRLPRAVFVNKLDRDRASFSRTLDDLKEKFGAGIA
ncbi:MAG: GTP-binding protein, partial [Acidimicrobiia bacterium]